MAELQVELPSVSSQKLENGHMCIHTGAIREVGTQYTNTCTHTIHPIKMMHYYWKAKKTVLKRELVSRVDGLENKILPTGNKFTMPRFHIPTPGGGGAIGVAIILGFSSLIGSFSNSALFTTSWFSCRFLLSSFLKEYFSPLSSCPFST